MPCCAASRTTAPHSASISVTRPDSRSSHIDERAVASMADYEALTRRLFEGDDNIKRFRTSVALASLKTGLRVPLDSAAPAA